MPADHDPTRGATPPKHGHGARAGDGPHFALPALLLALILVLVAGCGGAGDDAEGALGGAAADSGDGEEGDGAGDVISARFINHSSAPLVGVTAQDEGFFEQAGIDVEFAELPTGTEAIAAMIGGSSDFVLAADARLIQSVGQDLGVVAVGIHNTGFLGSLIVGADNDEVEDMSDLVGQRLAVQVGSGVHTVWLRYLDEVGLSPDDFEVTNMAVADMPAALQGGSIDGGLVWQPHGARSELQGISRTAMTSHQIAEPLGLVYPFYLLTTEDVVENEPDKVQRFVNAFTCAKTWIGENPDGALENLGGFYEDLETEVVQVMFDERDYATHMEITDEVIEDTVGQAEQLVANGDITEVPDVASHVDNSFVENALADAC